MRRQQVEQIQLPPPVVPFFPFPPPTLQLQQLFNHLRSFLHLPPPPPPQEPPVSEPELMPPEPLQELPVPGELFEEEQVVVPDQE